MRTIEFSTQAQTVSERRRQWCTFMGSGAIELDDDGIQASIRGADVGVTRICAVELGGHRVTAEGTPRARSTPPLLKMIFQEQGEGTFEQGGRSLTLHAGEWCAYDKSRPHCIRNGGFSRQTAIVLPFATLPQSSGIEKVLMAGYAFTQGADHVLHSTLVAGVGQIGLLSDGNAHLLSRALIELLKLTVLGRSSGARALSHRQARRDEMLGYVEQHLDDPALDVETIARAFSCSKRYIHKLFLDHGTTIARAIWERRLERCRAQLSDSGAANLTITRIAFTSGFSDSHHFSRLFKERFGTSPRDFRKYCCAH